MSVANKSDQAFRNRRISDFLALTKPGLTFVAVSTAAGGAFLGLTEPFDYLLLLHVFIGAYFAGAGAGALNQYIERESDARMTRTGLRPLPAGRLDGREAFLFGISLAVIGIIYLFIFTTLTAGLIAIVTLVVYLLLYTPLKRRTPAALYIGGIAGALPPLIGWTGVNQDINLAGISLILILFLWQTPHFLSLAWIYRDDYKRAGYKVSTVTDLGGRSAGRQILLSGSLLIPVSLMPALTGIAGIIYIITALILSVVYFAAGFYFYRQRINENARILFIVSVAYIPALFTMLVIDKLAV